MPSLPKKITIDQNAKKMFVDGVEFPWYITAEGVAINGVGSNHTIPTVTFSLMADTVEVIPQIPDVP